MVDPNSEDRSFSPEIFPSELEAREFPPEKISTGITIGAIAKNESRYIVEWIAYHLAIGINRLIIYSNETEDDQCNKLEVIAQNDHRISWRTWPSISGSSPQISAYEDIASRVSTPWLAFNDVDEFIVPLKAKNIHGWLATIPEDVSSIHINWRGFGSAGREVDDYELVSRTFNQAASRGWGNHHHFKSVARTKLIQDIHIHNIVTSSGRRVLSDLKDFVTVGTGQSDRIAHHEIQVNHYQCKTFPEFEKRMRRGDPNFPTDHPARDRDRSIERFRQLDLNEEEDNNIRRFDDAVDQSLEKIRSLFSK